MKIKDAATINEILSSKQPADTIDQKIADKDVQIYGVKVDDKLKLFFTKIFLKIAAWFS